MKSFSFIRRYLQSFPWIVSSIYIILEATHPQQRRYNRSQFCFKWTARSDNVKYYNELSQIRPLFRVENGKKDCRSHGNLYRIRLTGKLELQNLRAAKTSTSHSKNEECIVIADALFVAGWYCCCSLCGLLDVLVTTAAISNRHKLQLPSVEEIVELGPKQK